MEMKKSAQEYWQRNIRLQLFLIAIWAIVGYGCSILFVQPLNAIKMGGFPLGFWFAQQGSIYVFVILIFAYIFRMNKLDREYDVHE